MIDWEFHLATIYSTLGVAATLVVAETNASYSLTVIHKTEGITIEEGVDVYSNKPAVAVRVADLTTLGLTESALNNGTLTYNGVDWTVKAHQPRTFPSGGGEMWLILSDEAP